MTEHPRELLARFDRLAAGSSERRRVAAHLEACEACAGVVEAFREIDGVLLRPSVTPPPLGRLEARLEGAARGMRRAAVGLVVLVGVEIVAGIVLLSFLREEPLVIAIIAAALLSDTGLLLGIALANGLRAERYEQVAADWAHARETWRSHLTASARSALVGALSSGLLVCLGAMMLGLGLGRSSSLQIGVGILCLAVAAVGFVVHPRRRRRALREQRAMEDLFPAEPAP
jgi:hypothetical protein